MKPGRKIAGQVLKYKKGAPDKELISHQQEC